MINFPVVEISMEIEDLNETKGYRIEIMKSSSFGFEDINRKIERDSMNRVISDTYLTYFDIEVDK